MECTVITVVETNFAVYRVHEISKCNVIVIAIRFSLSN